MKAIILAAGYGNRMRPLTNDTHKTLLKIGDKTIIERIIDGLVENAIKDIVIVTGYLHDKLTKFLLDNYKNINFTFIENKKYAQTNNIYSLALAFENIKFDDDYLLIESDLIYEPKVIEKIVKSPYKNAALVDKYTSGMDGTVVKIYNNIITNVIPSHLQGKNFDFSNKYKTLNIYKFSKDFCNNEFKKMLTYYSKTFDNNCYYELILGILIYMQRETIHAEILNGEKWAEVDDPNDLRGAEFVFCPEKRREILQNTFGGYWNYDILDFCFIRNMYFPNDSVISEIKNNISDLIYNYGSKQSFLNEKLSYFLCCNKENIQLLNGAAQIYPILEKYFEPKKSKGLIPNPAFGEYLRIFNEITTYHDLGEIDLREIDFKKQNADVVVFINPNNPTGTTLKTEYIKNFALQNSDKLIIVDESFIEFSSEPSIIDYLEKETIENILVIKSLSKSFGFPGIRLGFCYTQNKELMDFLKKSIPIWNTNSIAEFMLEVMMKHKNSIKKSYQQTIEDREEFSKLLEKTPIVNKVFNSGANFILAEINVDTEKLVDRLLVKNAIFIKNADSKFNDGKHYIRLAVRTPIENKELMEALYE